MVNKTKIVSRRLSQITAQYRSSFQSSDKIGKGILIAAPLLVACCLCAVPIVVFAPDSTPTPEIPTVAEIAIAEDEPTSTQIPEPSAEPTSSPIPTDSLEPTNTAASTNTLTIESSVSPSVPKGDIATVINVIDGDTIEVEIGGQVFQLRYIGIDTPERGEAFANESTAENERLVTGKNVILAKDSSDTDRYGRLLRYACL